MKGKGQLTTYWLTASEFNPEVNKAGLAALDAEVKQVLYEADYGNNKERSSKEKMDKFSPRKMQKVAMQLDKLALNVVRKNSLLCGDEEKEETKEDFPPLPKHFVNRAGCDPLGLSDHDPATVKREVHAKCRPACDPLGSSAHVPATTKREGPVKRRTNSEPSSGKVLILPEAPFAGGRLALPSARAVDRSAVLSWFGPV